MVPLATAAALFTLNFLPQSPPSESRVESDTYFYGDSPPVYPSRAHLPSPCSPTVAGLCAAS